MTFRKSFTLVLVLFFATVSALVAVAQETTGGLQGTVKDASGAVVSNATVSLTGSSLVGTKSQTADSNGYYRFANLPPGNYTLTVEAKGFNTLKRSDINIGVGRLPTLDIALKVGTADTVVEVTSEAPVIDVTTTRSMTNVTQDVLADVPHGRSFQSVIQFAPSARNEPLAGNVNGGTGGSLPGSSGNGLNVGFSIGGAADSENAYLVEGQDTENISGGYSKANVPYQFIQEVQVKTSGIEAEHGGALGGVVNVVMKKGGNQWHGQVFTYWEGDKLDANNNNTFLQYDPNAQNTQLNDPGTQLYRGRKDGFRVLQPGATLGGAIVKDKLFFFVGFAPEFNSLHRTVDFTPADPTIGIQRFNRDEKLWYGMGRLDYAATQKIRLFASWLYQYSRETGASIPTADPVNSSFNNTSVFTPLSAYASNIGWSAPNSTYNFGADITLSPKVVSTTRFGYFFENYHDFGWPTTGVNLVWNTSVDNTTTDNTGQLLPAAASSLINPAGATTAPYNSSYTLYNASKHYQFNEDVAFFKSGWGGTHNFKFGYQLNHLSNVINQNGNVPEAFLNVGYGLSHGPATTNGGANCGTLASQWTDPTLFNVNNDPNSSLPAPPCAGQFGYVTVQDFATILTKPASDWNHALFAQDSWTIGKGLTINAGIRIEKERLPAPTGVNVKTIDFSWGDKIAPRLGLAWDPLRNGKMKVFGSYGVVNDVMKLLIAQTSWGAQAYEQCTYALGPNASGGFNVSDINLTYVNNRACPNGLATQGANFVGGTTPSNFVDPTGVSLVENVNLRPWEPIAPGVKPYRQHESTIGWDYQLSNNVAFETRWDRRRLDHVIEDASLADPTNFEIYTIVNPGEGVNKTIDGYASYLASLGESFGVPGMAFNADGSFGTCPTCPNNPKAVRDYDGLELRLTKNMSNHWGGMFAYTWSRLWGNYTGLTTTDQSDGGGHGRNSPDTTRAFDEPFYYFQANGKSVNGPLPTDRPNTLKGYVYYQLPWGHRATSTFGFFQSAYQGSPVSSYADVGLACCGEPIESVYLYGFGKWADVNTNPDGSFASLGTPHSRRTPWYNQTDFNFVQNFKVNPHRESMMVGFDFNVINLLNQHSVTAYYQGMNSIYQGTPGLFQYQIFNGASFYQTAETGYNVQQQLTGTGFAKSSWYGQPFSYQAPRTVRLGVHFDF
jgi:hypothetical protein